MHTARKKTAAFPVPSTAAISGTDGMFVVVVVAVVAVVIINTLCECVWFALLCHALLCHALLCHALLCFALLLQEIFIFTYLILSFFSCHGRFGFKQIMKRHVENIHVNGRVGRRPGTYGAYNKSGVPVESNAGLAVYESQLDTNELVHDRGMKDIRSFDYLSDPTVTYLKRTDLNIFNG